MRMLRRALFSIVAFAAAIYLGVIVYAYWPRDPGMPAKQLAGPGDLFADTELGAIRYRLYGQQNSAGTAFVLIHGFANNLHSFDELAPLLAEGNQVLALDLQGFGLSAKPADSRLYTYRTMAEVAVEVARQAGFANPVYVGHSLGGVVAVWGAALDPGTSGLVLIEPGIYAGESIRSMTAFSVFPLPRLAALQFADPAFRTSMISRSYFDASILGESDIDKLMLASRTDDYLTGMTAVMNSVPSGDDELDLLGKVTQPVIVFWATGGSNETRGAERLQGDLPQSLTFSINDSGHYLHEEQAEEVAALTLEHVDAWRQ